MGLDMKEKEIFQDISDAVQQHDETRLLELITQGIEKGLKALDIREAMFHGLDAVRKGLMSPHSNLPEFLLCLDAWESGLKRVLPLLEQRDETERITIVMGVIQGDVHDLGKNILAGIYRSSGSLVIDLGRDVSPIGFVNAVKENNAHMVCISSMISTTLPNVREAVNILRRECPRCLIMVGGATFDREIAQELGADGYAESAVTILEETRRLLSRAKKS